MAFAVAWMAPSHLSSGGTAQRHDAGVRNGRDLAACKTAVHKTVRALGPRALGWRGMERHEQPVDHTGRFTTRAGLATTTIVMRRLRSQGLPNQK